MNTRNLILAAAVAAGLCAGQARGATIYSATNGNWTATATWVGGVMPGINDDAIITNGCTVTMTDAVTRSVSNLTIQAGGVLTHSGPGSVYTENTRVALNIVSNLTIATGGAINVDGKGFASLYGPGYYRPTAEANCGGSHGGMGGYFSGNYPRKTYGSITAPTNWGSGGESADGAGAVVLAVGGETVLNGRISAVGGGTLYAGAGGSVFLTTATLTGTGTIAAGYGVASIGSRAQGGGGRIAVILTNDNSFGSVTMLAAARSGSESGQGSPGTIYTQTKDQGPGKGTLLIDAKGVTPGALSTTLIWPGVTDTTVGTVIITNKPVVVLSNQTMTVYGDWDNKATFIGVDNSTVKLAGTNAATVNGHNTFVNLISTNTGKTLSFEDGKTNTVDGVLTLANVTADSISGGAWYLKASAFTHSVSNVTAGRSDARPGYQITAYDSTDLGGNSNWVFTTSGPQVNRWQGTDTDWTKATNWSQGRPTVETDDVIIPGGCSNYPLLNLDKRIKSLAISNGASLNMAGYNLTVDGNLRSAGALTAVGAATIRVGGDVDFSGGGTFNAASSSVWVAGSAAQTVASGGNAFYLLTVSNTAGVFFSDAVSAGSMLCRNGDLTFHDNVTADSFYSDIGGLDLTFGSGKMATFGALELYGRSGLTNVLRGDSDGISWGLRVTNSSKVWHVDAKDSDASTGQTIVPVAGVNSGGNTNWEFTAGWRTWNGSVSSSFTNGGNWSPSGLLDAGSRLLIDGYYATAPVLSGVATASQLIVGNVTTATFTVNGHLVVQGDAEILPKGTMTHTANTTTEAYKLYLTVGGDLTISGTINVDGKGYQPLYGPGGLRVNPEMNHGGSHGGMGGYADGNYPRTTYGSITAPTNCGSGGEGHSGGGVVVLRVSGETALNGAISAVGAGGTSMYCGAGGSVFLTTATLAGSGTIAVGYGVGAGSIARAAGGGGRIAVILTNGNSFGSVAMLAGSRQATQGGQGSPGTVYTRTRDQEAGKGTLLIDAKGVVPGAFSTTLIWPSVTDTTVGTVIITNKPVVVLSNQTMTVNGNWENTATFLSMNNGTLQLAGTNAARILGSNTFYNLTCTNAGKVLSFEAGKTNTVNGLLKLGASQSGQMVTLQSTTNGIWSYLTLVPGGTQTIARVNVKDNNAGGGQTILVSVGSVNGGNNINWQFPPSGTMFMVK